MGATGFAVAASSILSYHQGEQMRDDAQDARREQREMMQDARRADSQVQAPRAPDRAATDRNRRPRPGGSTLLTGTSGAGPGNVGYNTLLGQ